MTARRWGLIDSIRGFALTGIILVNSIDITEVGSRLFASSRLHAPEPTRVILDLFVQTRFVPIFAFLFGMSFAFVISSARRNAEGARPWLIMLRRLLCLTAIGAALALAYPDNILIEYGIVGLLLLPVILVTPPVVMVVLGAVATVVTALMFGSGTPTLFGLMLLGAGSAAMGLPALLERGGRPILWSFTILLLLAIPALVVQSMVPGDPRFTIGGAFGTIFAGLYIAGFSLLWQSPGRNAVAAFFDPLGRMALSNYIGAALVFFVLTRIFDFSTMPSVLPVMLISIAVIALQSLISRMWLRRHRYGPVEWLWRIGTWWSRPKNA